MSDIQVKEVYLALNNLLEDICKFLSGDTFQSFSADDKQIASELIHRTRKQLEEMPQLLIKLNETEEYVDMSKKYSTINDATETKKRNRNRNITILKENTSNESTVINYKTECPYTELSADSATSGGKCGHLWIRRRIFLKQKVFVSLQQQWLLIYANETESKPFHYFNMKFCQAREVEKNSRSFVLVYSKNKEKKNYIFMAKMPDDVTEWINKINTNNCHEEDIRDEEYDIIEPKPDVEENIYNEPEMICPRLQQKPVENDCTNSKPPLPPGRSLIPPPPLWRNSRTSFVSYNEVEDEEQVKIENKTEKNMPNDSADLRLDNSTNIFESLNFEEGVFNFPKNNDKNIIKISRNSANLTNFCPFSKLRTFKITNSQEIKSFEEKKLKVKDYN